MDETQYVAECIQEIISTEAALYIVLYTLSECKEFSLILVIFSNNTLLNMLEKDIKQIQKNVPFVLFCFFKVVSILLYYTVK